MISIDVAKQINAEVRKHYANGLKSSNKLYSLDYGTKPLEKKEARNEIARQAAQALIQHRARKIKLSDLHKIFPIVGNCGEQSCLAANFAHEQVSSPTSHIFTMLIDSHNPNHQFCVFNLPAQHPHKLGALQDMSKCSDPSVEDTVVCDPWANIACYYKEYPSKLQEKMQKWEQEGKVISAYLKVHSATEWGQKILQTEASMDEYSPAFDR